MAPQRLTQFFPFCYSHEADLFGQNPGAFDLELVLMGEAFLPIYIANCHEDEATEQMLGYFCLTNSITTETCFGH